MATTYTYIKIKEVQTEDYRYEVFRQEENSSLHLVSYYTGDELEEEGVDVEEMPESDAIRVFGALFNIHIVDDKTGLCNY